ncbi:hypothetical protein CU098_008897, partial [Rhizopus stolonifer]
TGRLADIVQKSAVLFLAGTTVYYMVNVGVLARLNGLSEKEALHTETSTTPTPLPDTDTPGTVKEL